MAKLSYTWLRGAWHPLRRHRDQANAAFSEGVIATFDPELPRSDKTHRHEFAWLQDAWLSLPEELADEFPTKEHLRKRGLIATGFYHETLLDVGTVAGALRVASHLRHEDDFAHVVTRGGLVVIRKAKSQAKGAMDATEFQKSKTALLGWISDLLGVEPATLERQAA